MVALKIREREEQNPDQDSNNSNVLLENLANIVSATFVMMDRLRRATPYRGQSQMQLHSLPQIKANTMSYFLLFHVHHRNSTSSMNSAPRRQSQQRRHKMPDHPSVSADISATWKAPSPRYIPPSPRTTEISRTAQPISVPLVWHARSMPLPPPTPPLRPVIRCRTLLWRPQPKLDFSSLAPLQQSPLAH